MKFDYARNYWIICIALLFFMISFNLILPELNVFITNMGGEDQKGLIIALFSISALVSRPFSGKLSDTIGRKKVMIFGMVVGVVITLLYPFFGLVSIFLFLRFLHGFSAGFLPTGATALITDILPPSKRGRGMGLWGVFTALGIGIGQFLGSMIRIEFGMTNLFYISACFALLSGIMIMTVRETLSNPVKFKWSLLKIKWIDVFEPRIMPVAIVMFLSAVSSGIVFAITQDISGFLKIENKGWFFGFYMLSTIAVRLFTGGLSDKIGRRKTLIIGMSFMVISMGMVAIMHEWIMYTSAAVMFGVSTGITSPSLFAWMADLSHPDRRGIGAGTLFIALELGIIFGSASTLLTYNNNVNSIIWVFGFGSFLALLAIIYLIWHLKRRTSIT